MMKLCMMSMCMTGRTPQQIAEAAVACGLHGIDWVGTHDAKPAELRKISEDYGLTVVGHTSLLDGFIRRTPDWLDDVKRGIEFGAELGVHFMMIPPFARVDQKDIAEGQHDWIEYFEAAVPLAQAADIQLTIEATGFTASPISTAEEQLALLKAVPGLKITYDNGNIATSGQDQVEAWEMLKDYVPHVHIKDWKITDEEIPGSELKRCGKYFSESLIGEGNLDIASTVKAIQKSGYDGWVNLECFTETPEISHEMVMQRGCAYLRSLGING